MGHYARKSSIIDDDDTNNDGIWTTDYPISSPEPFCSSELNIHYFT